MMEFHKLLCRHLGDIASLRERRLARLDIPKNTPPPTPEGEEEDDAEMPQSTETKIDLPNDLMNALEQLGRATGKERDRQKQKIAVITKRAEELIIKYLMGKWDTESKREPTDQTTEKKIQFIEKEISNLIAFLAKNNIDAKVDKSGNVRVTLKVPDSKTTDQALAPVPNFENMGGPNGRARLLKGLSGSLAEVFGQSYDRLSKPEQEIVARSLGGANPELKAQLYEAIKQYARLNVPIAKELTAHPFVFLDPSRLADTQMLLEEGAKNGLPREQDRLILGLVRQSLDTVAASVRKQMTPEQLKQYEEGQRKLQEHVQENMTEKDRILLNGKQAVNLFRSGRIWEGLLMLIQCYGDFIDALKNKTLGKTQKELGKVNKKPDKPETPVEQKNRAQSELEAARSEHKDAVTTRDRIKDGLQKLREEKAKGAEATVIDPKIAKAEAELKTAEAVVVEKKKNLDAAEKKMKDLDKPAAGPKEGGAERGTENPETSANKSRHEAGTWYLEWAMNGVPQGDGSIKVDIGDNSISFLFKNNAWLWNKPGTGPMKLSDKPNDLDAEEQKKYGEIQKTLEGDMANIQKSKSLQETGEWFLKNEKSGSRQADGSINVTIGSKTVNFLYNGKAWHWEKLGHGSMELADKPDGLNTEEQEKYKEIQKVLAGDLKDAEKSKSLHEIGSWYLTWNMDGSEQPDGSVEVHVSPAKTVNFLFRNGSWLWNHPDNGPMKLTDKPENLNAAEKEKYESIQKILGGDVSNIQKSKSLHETGEWYLRQEQNASVRADGSIHVQVGGKTIIFLFKNDAWHWEKPVDGLMNLSDKPENLNAEEQEKYKKIQKILEPKAK